LPLSAASAGLAEVVCEEVDGAASPAGLADVGAELVGAGSELAGAGAELAGAG